VCSTSAAPSLRQFVRAAIDSDATQGGELFAFSFLSKLGRALSQGPFCSGPEQLIPTRVVFLPERPHSPAPRNADAVARGAPGSKASSRGSYQEKMAVTGDGIVLTYWHWLEYDSVALAALFGGIGPS
jgi:hypothetical protein